MYWPIAPCETGTTAPVVPTVVIHPPGGPSEYYLAPAVAPSTSQEQYYPVQPPYGFNSASGYSIQSGCAYNPSEYDRQPPCHYPVALGTGSPAPSALPAVPGSNSAAKRPGGSQSAIPATMVELSMSAKNLLDRDTFSKSDPVCILYMKEFNSDKWIERDRTELVKNNLNPIWNKKFTLEYRFEERQMLRFVIYDWDGDSSTLNDHDFLGSMRCSLGEIVAAPNKRFEQNLVLPPRFDKRKSQLIVVAEELGSSKEVVSIKMSGRRLDKKDFLGKSDPYVIISKLMDDGTWVNAHKTEVIKNTLNPDWRPFSVRVASLTGGNLERKLRFQCYDWNSNGSSNFIGEFESTYVELLGAAKESRASYPLINPTKKAKKKSYSNSGTLNVEWMRIEEEKTFVDYIQDGVQLQFTVAIDFTASNGHPSNPKSLHYNRNPCYDNQYSLAIKAVGEIIEDYDSDRRFPALGFGAKIPGCKFVCDDFYLDPTNAFCFGIQGILDAYQRCLNTVRLSGPTNFAPVINHVARTAAKNQDGKNYFILLIITDGIICDMVATKEAIINASVLPMSVIIVGVGDEDFSAMEFLDSDGRRLQYDGKFAVRDIVQFVEMRNYMTPSGAFNSLYSKASLARSVLAELPDQLVEWMQKHKRVHKHQRSSPVHR